MVQRIVFTGRYHQDFASVDADQGETEEWNVRRVRFGPRITFFRNYLFHTEVEVNPQEQDPFYVRLTDAYVAWSRNPVLTITVGKHSVPFTQEGATSSRELLTIDRSNLANNIWFGTGIHAGRERVGPQERMDVSGQRVFLGRGQP